MNENPPLTVKSADRVLTLFELLARHGRGMTHSELAEELGVPKSSLSQLVRTLLARDYLSYGAVEKTYQLGPMFGHLARITSRAQDLVGLAEPLLHDLTRIAGESSALNVQEGNCSKVVATVNSSHRLVTMMRLNDTAPLHATSGGKAILAFLPEEAIDNYLSELDSAGVTPNTITQAGELRRQIEEIRAERFAYAREEFTIGIIGVARPIFSASQEVLGSLSIAMPVVRYNRSAKRKLTAALADVATILEKRLA